MKLKRYNEFIILEKIDTNLRNTLIEMGLTDKEELEKQIDLAKTGYLAAYLHQNGDKFTFGVLKAIFKDAIKAKKVTDVKRGIFQALPSVIPTILAPFFPIIAIIGSIFGASRTFHKVFNPIFEYLHPSSKYSNFLKRMIDSYMKIPEGDVKFKDRFTIAFVVSDRLIDAIKPEILDAFSTALSEKMQIMDDDDVVPDHFIENELKMFLNKNFDVDPEIPLKTNI